jgi:hypothetical protein
MMNLSSVFLSEHIMAPRANCFQDTHFEIFAIE